MQGADIVDGVASVRAMAAIAQSVRSGAPVRLADAQRADLMRVGVFAKTFAAKGALASLSAVRRLGLLGGAVQHGLSRHAVHA